MSPGRPDPPRIRRHLTALHAEIANLRRHTGTSTRELRENHDLRRAVERGLQLCAQNALDIATHLASAAGVDTPDYASSIDHLADAGILPRAFSARFRHVAGFRNVLVHGYLDVDLDMVAEALRGGIDDFETFVRHVERLLVA